MTDRPTPEATLSFARVGDWPYALLAVALVPLFLETIAIWQWLQETLSPRVLAWLPLALAVSLGGGVLAWSVHAVGRGLVADGPWRRLAWLTLGLVCAAAAIHLTDANFPAKKVHLFQYALLALVVRRAYGDRFGGPRLAAASIVTAALLGVHDELLQGLHAERRFGAVDIVVNALSAAAGAFVAAAAARSGPAGRRHVGTNQAIAIAASLAGVAILVTTLAINAPTTTSPVPTIVLLAPFAGLACWVVLTRSRALSHLTPFAAVAIGLGALTVVPPLVARWLDIPFV